MPSRAHAAAALSAFPWTAKVTTFAFKRRALTIGTAHDLFSSAAVDVGTARLLRTLEAKGSPLERASLERPLRVLDLGCGVGTIGLAIATALPDGSVHVTLSDRDRLAVAMTRENARANGLDPDSDRCRVLAAGVGYAPCRAARTAPFDLIVSNVPAKVGEDGLRELLLGAGPLLEPGGSVAFVHVTPLTETIDSLRAENDEAAGGLETTKESAGKEHRALHWRFERGLPANEAGDALAPWRRFDAPSTILLRGTRPLEHVAVKDVEEFDTPHHRTVTLSILTSKSVPRARREERERILVLNPNHGFVAALLANRREPATIELIGRDTLAIATARANLDATLARWSPPPDVDVREAAGRDDWTWLPRPASPPHHGYHLIVGHLLSKEGKQAHVATLGALREALADDGRIVIAVGTGQLEGLKRLAKAAGLRFGRDERRHGYVAIVLRSLSADSEDG